MQIKNLNLSSFVKKYENTCSPMLIKAINDIIYNAPMEDAGVVGNEKIKKETRNAKLLNLNDNTIGTSVAKRVIYNDIARLIKKIEWQYQNELGVLTNSQNFSMEFLK